MKQRLFLLVLSIVLILSSGVGAGAAPRAASRSAPEGELQGLPIAEAATQSQPPAPAVRLADPPPTSPAAQINEMLYPQDIKPPEACFVPRKAPLGEDVEVMLGPWYGPAPLLALDQAPVWQTEDDLPGAAASKDLDVIALTSEELVAAWRDTDSYLQYATWGTRGGWSGAQQVGIAPASGKPALISRQPQEWAVFARFGGTIRVAYWTAGTGAVGDWQEIGVTDAVSDPQVVLMDPGHMALFYKAADGTVKFTEWDGVWLSQPVPLATSTASASADTVALTIVSDLTIVSRDDSHVAAFGVDGSNQLWMRERSDQNAPDWSDTEWVKLMDGVENAKPAVASRHANHIGVVVKSTAGQAFYAGWSMQAPEHKWVQEAAYLPITISGSAVTSNLAPAENLPGTTSIQAPAQVLDWSDPVPMGEATFASPMTLVARSPDSMIVLGVQSDNRLYEAVWTEDGGWGDWEAITVDIIKADQVIAGTQRFMNDVMVLGRKASGNGVWYKHYSKLDEPVTDQQISSALEGHPRAQALAFVDGTTLWASVTRDGGSGTWQVTAREISTGLSGYLELDHADSDQDTNRVSVAAADLDLDGDTELVVATLQLNLTKLDLSVLEFSFPDASTLSVSAAQHLEWGPLLAADDVNVAIGDLDGDGERNEVVVGYNAADSMVFGLFQYGDSGLVRQGGSQSIVYANYSGTTVGGHDLEIAIGRVYPNYIPPLEREQLVVLDSAEVVTNGLHYAQDWIGVRELVTDTWALDPLVSGSLLDPDSPGPASPIAGTPYSAALDTGDTDADGLQNIVYTLGDRIVVANAGTLSITYKSMTGLPDTERSLAVGDVDRDGRFEMAVGFRDSGSTAFRLVEMVEGNTLRVSGQRPVNGGRTVLTADVDANTYVAELAGCKTFSEARVSAVINGAPRWYENGAPLHNSGTTFAQVKDGSTDRIDDGLVHRYGGGFTVGYEWQWSDPITGIKISSAKVALTTQFMGSSGTKVHSTTSTTAKQGWGYSSSPSLGLVIYTSTEFTCYYYDVYPPSDPEAKNRAMLCKPTGRANAESAKVLEDWHDPGFKQAAGPSWVDVGHRTSQGVHTNDLMAEPYPNQLPVEPSRVIKTWDGPAKIDCSSDPNVNWFWSFTDMTGGAREEIRTFDFDASLSTGIVAAGFVIEATGAYGLTKDWSNTTSWGTGFEVGGSVYFVPGEIQDSQLVCKGQCYDVVPYVYEATATSVAGVTYPYMAVDYYVPAVFPCATMVHENPEGHR